MGMFDSLYVTCKCGLSVEFQSKAGDCILATYTLDTAPNDVKGDLIGERETCRCGNTIELDGAVVLYAKGAK
jgi:hypothetical protein